MKKHHRNYDRSEPEFGEAPLFKMPEIWTGQLKNTGINVYGIENKEVPLVTFDLTFKGGHWLDPIDKSGTAYLLTDLMMEGTVNRTSEELEEAIGLLGASIYVSCGNEEIRITASCLSKNFEATVALINEILFEPRWDEAEFDRIKQSLQTRLKGNEANPNAIAFSSFSKLVYGDQHILGYPTSGTLETVKDITIDDLKAYYANNLSASLASIHVAGFIDEDRVVKAFERIDSELLSKEVDMPVYNLPTESIAGNVYFIDVPNARQSMLFHGCLTLSAGDEDFNNLQFANEILGGGSSGKLFQILRIEKGFTYGVYSTLLQNKEVSPFITYGSVRVNATKESMEIIMDLLRNYSKNFSEDDVEVTKNKVVKSNTRAFESLNAKLGIIRNISKYNQSMNYLDESQEELLT